MKKLLVLFLFLSSHVFALTGEEISENLQGEWSKFRTLVETLEADGDIGGYMDFKRYEDVTLLWRIDDDFTGNEVVRFYIPREGRLENFAVTYHKSTSIIDGRVVLRRFVGPEPTGWINYTIDYETGEYLGSQGFTPRLLENEVVFLREWGIWH